MILLAATLIVGGAVTSCVSSDDYTLQCYTYTFFLVNK